MSWQRFLYSHGILSIVSVGTWLALVVSGSLILIHYASRPGATMDASSKWPADTHLSRSAQHPTLIMFAHPHCPCSRASVDELADIVSECQGSVDVQIVFYCPNLTDANWKETSLVRQAAQLSKAAIFFDCNAQELQRFRATISGQVMLFSTTGKLLFNGGITASRGHVGESYGKSSVISLLRTPPQTILASTTAQRFPTFGCTLVQPEIASGAVN